MTVFQHRAQSGVASSGEVYEFQNQLRHLHVSLIRYTQSVFLVIVWEMSHACLYSFSLMVVHAKQQESTSTSSNHFQPSMLYIGFWCIGFVFVHAA